VLTTWVIMLLLAAVAFFLTRRLAIQPTPLQAAIEGIVSSIEAAIRAVAPGHTARLLPFVGSLWVFILVANLAGLIPGVHSHFQNSFIIEW